jgi:hypothetical protein
MYNYQCNGELKDVFNVKKKAVTTFIFLLALFLAAVNIYANISSVSGITISPANPSPGQAATVTWTFVNTYGPEPENYFITIYKSCTIPATGAGNDPQTEVIVGDLCAQPTPAANCLSCVSNSGCNGLGSVATAGTHTVSVPVTIPNDLIPGYTYYLDVAMASYNVYMNPDLTAQAQACYQFTVPLTAPYIKLNKVAEGTTANVGTDVLFTIYYDVGNVHNFTITDAVDSRFTILKVYSGGSWLGQNITWNSFPAYITSPQKGSVSFLAQVNSGVVGAVIPNTATGTSTDPATGSSTVGVAIGEPGLTIQKNASESSANAGDTITYTMQYNNLGTTLVEFQNFDDGLIPAGWTNNPVGGVWDAAPGYLEQTSTAAGYTGYMDSTMTPIHDGIYICDMLIPSSNTAHEDAVMHFIQVDSNNFYMARINASDKHLYLDKVVAGTSSIGGTSVADPHGINIVQDKWYTIKVQVCGSSIMMKIWPQGDNEYPAWDMVTTDASIPGNGIVGFQANEGPQKYDNLKIFSLTASTNPRIFDSVPLGISYQGCSGGTGCSKTGNVINWTLGSTCAGALAVSWTGVVTAACNSLITNVAAIDSDDPPPPVLSNGVIINVNGCSPTNTPTYSSTPTLTRTPANSPTYTPTSTSSPTQSASPSYTSTATFTVTNSSTWTKTATATVTGTNTVSSDTPTYTPSATKTFTPTQSFTGSATMTVTSTCTQTFTPTCTTSCTFTPTLTWTLSATDTESSNTPTATKTWTNTFTCTATYTDTPTGTFTATQSDTATSTQTSTQSVTPSLTPTVTKTFTDTPVFTATITATFSMTITQSRTYTVTRTYTATSTETLTYTATATLTPAPAILSINLDAQDPAISQGGQAVMKITLSNTGSAALNAVLSETLPAQAIFDTTLPANAGWTLAGNTISLDAGIINSGDTRTFYFTITAAQSVASGDSITFNAVSCAYGDAVSVDNIVYSSSKTIYVGDIEIYPNPFNPSTAAGGVMKFANMPGDSVITIYTISGEAVLNFYSKQSVVPWDGKNMNGKVVSPGIYYYLIRLKNSTRVLTGKIFVIKQ